MNATNQINPINPTNPMDIYTSIEIDISNVCNLNCPLCHREAYGAESYDLKNKVNMTLDTFKRIVEIFPNLERFYLGFLINEPTLHPDFIKIVAYLKSQKKKITLSTNGNTFATLNDKNNKFWRSFLMLLEPEDKIIWAVDGFTEEVYHQYRKGGSLAKVLTNIDRATNIRPDINHTIQTIMFKHNKEHIEEGYENFKELYHYRFNLPTWSMIDCCGDCSMNSDEVEPVWDKKQWLKIKSEVTSGPSFRCESRDNKIIFVDHMGRIGFCPTQLTKSVMDLKEIDSAPANVNDSIEVISKYIDDCYNGRTKNKNCQFNCGVFAKLKKQKAGLDGIHTK